MNCSAAIMKYAYIKRSVRQHLYRKPTKSSKKIHKFATIILGAAAIIFVIISELNEKPSTLVFENTSFAEVVGDQRDDSAIESAEGNPTVAEPITKSVVIEEIKSTFPVESVDTAIAIARAESRLVPEKDSDLDIMQDGRPFSVGVFQINITWHELGGHNCPAAFRGKSFKAVVIDEELYDTCVKLARDYKVNINKAHDIYKRSGESFGRWTTFITGDYKQFM